MSHLHVSTGISLKKASARAENHTEGMFAKRKSVRLSGRNLQLMENGILKEVNKWVNYK
jgi:hypothetical protein